MGKTFPFNIHSEPIISFHLIVVVVGVVIFLCFSFLLLSLSFSGLDKYTFNSCLSLCVFFCASFSYSPIISSRLLFHIYIIRFSISNGSVDRMTRMLLTDDNNSQAYYYYFYKELHIKLLPLPNDMLCIWLPAALSLRIVPDNATEMLCVSAIKVVAWMNEWMNEWTVTYAKILLNICVCVRVVFQLDIIVPFPLFSSHHIFVTFSLVSGIVVVFFFILIQC